MTVFCTIKEVDCKKKTLQSDKIMGRSVGKAKLCFKANHRLYLLFLS